MADSKHANETNLETFLEDFVAKHLNFSQSDNEVQVVQQLVHEMVNNIVTDAYSPESGLTVREVISVGSMAEGTRIIQPNEFDFMIVVKKFDGDDITETIQDDEGTFLKFKTECRRKTCCYALKDLSLLSVDLATEGSYCDCQLAMLDKEIRTFRTQGLFNAILKMVEDFRSSSVESFLGRLRMAERVLGVQGPAVTVKLLWEKYGVKDELKISVDLVVVTEVEINAFLLDRLDVFNQHFYNKLKETKKVHIMNPKDFRSCEFKVSFALTEVQLFRDESETHKKCYKLLKYIFRTNESCLHVKFSSFALKNLVLQHAVCCEGGGLGWCLLKILGDLRDKFDNDVKMPLIPHIFSTKKDLVRRDLSTMAVTTHKDSMTYTYKDFMTDMEWRTYHRNNLSEFIENLEKFRDGSPIPGSFQFRIPNHTQ